MRRFRLGKDIWAIEQVGKTLEITAVGATTVRRFVGDAQASTQLDKLVAERLAAGFVELTAGADDRTRELERAVDEQPDDGGAWSVYGDHLAELGDPRGALITMQLAEEAAATNTQLRKDITAYITEHGRALLGPLAGAFEEAGDHRDGPLVWRRGFWDRLVLDSGNLTSELAHVAKRALAHPSSRRLRALALRSARQDVTEIAVEIAAALPASLRELELRRARGTLTRVWKAVPQLRRLALWPGDGTRSVESLLRADLPDLDELLISLDDPEVSVAPVARLIERDGFPALTRVGLRHGPAMELIPVILASPLASRLVVLDLGDSPLDSGHAAMLVRARATLRKLRELRVVDDDTGGIWRDLAKLGAKLVAPREDSPLAGDDDGDHYDEIAE